MLVEEDTTWDSETTHTSEVVSYVAIQGDGTLTAVRRQTIIQRTTYRLAGQAIAVKVSGSPADDGLYYVHSDHLGSASVLSNAGGGLVPGSEARYLPFGGWRTQPTSNPGLTDMGFTGHKHNNSSSHDLGLIYMNARYYVPYINRFVSADSIVPDPANPQSYNRYSYVLNRPLSLIDPTGHWYYDPACDCLVDTSESYNEHPSNLSIPTAESMTDDSCSVECWVATYSLIELLIKQGAEIEANSNNNSWPDWTYTRWFPDYVTVQWSFPVIGLLSFSITLDDYFNIYGSVGGSLSVPDILSGSIRGTGGWIVGKQEAIKHGIGVEWNHKLFGHNSPTEAELKYFLTGWSGSIGGGNVLGVDGVATISTTDPSVAGAEVGLYTPMAGIGASHGWLLFDSGEKNPWFWQRYWGLGVTP